MKKILLIIACFGVGMLGGYFASRAQHLPTFGAVLPGTPSVFETYLSNSVGTADTSIALASVALRDGTNLSGYQCVTVDSNTPTLEYFCGTMSGTTLGPPNFLRGIDAVTATTSVASLKFAHRRGGDVKITDYPTLAILRNQLNGSETIQNLLAYANTVLIGAGSATTTLATKYYVDNTAVAGSPNADTITKGIVQIGTALQTASSTALGSTGAFLSLVTANATDTPQTGCAVGYAGIAGAGCSIIADLTGHIKQAWLDLTKAFTFSGAVTFSNSVSLPSSVTWNGTSVAPKFGGSGTNGVLNITTGTTTINVGSASVYELDYTSVNISSGAGLAFSGSNTNGTTVYIRSQGNTTIAGGIDLSGIGATSGNSAIGTLLTIPTGASSGNAYSTSTASHLLNVTPGAGGSIGISGLCGGPNNNGGTAGGALILEVGNTYTFTGYIKSNGAVGANGSNPNGAGGGAGGTMLIMYNQIGTNTGSYIANGGNGGIGTCCGNSASGPYGSGGAGSSNRYNGGAGGAGGSGTGSVGSAGSNSSSYATMLGGSGAAGASSCGYGAGGGGGGGSAGDATAIQNTYFF